MKKTVIPFNSQDLLSENGEHGTGMPFFEGIRDITRSI
jgi:hypothetical protein